MLKSYLFEICFLSVFGCLSLIKHFKLSYDKLNLTILSLGGAGISYFFLIRSCDNFGLLRLINYCFV